MAWQDWEYDLGPDSDKVLLAAGPAVASWGPGRLDVFVNAANKGNELYQKSFDRSGHPVGEPLSKSWANWKPLGGTIVDAPAAVSWGPDRIDCFARGTNDHIFHGWMVGSAWSGWQEDMGDDSGDILLAAGPAVASWGVNRLDVFVNAANKSNAMYHKWWDGTRWNAWESWEGTIVGAPAAVSWGTRRVDCFARGTNDHIFHSWWDDNNFGAWQEDMGSDSGDTLLAAGPATCSWGPNRLDIFVNAANQRNSMYHKLWNGASWSGWESLGGTIVDSPASVGSQTGGSRNIDCFARGQNDHIFQLRYVESTIH